MAESIHRISYRIGTHRIRTPEETLARVMPHMVAMGITRIADVTGLDNIGIPVVMVCRPNSRSVSVSQGKGCTLAAARASGLMESVEGYHAEHVLLPLRFACMEDMRQSARMAAIDSLPRLEGSPFNSQFPITWIESEDLVSGQSLWLPYEMVHTNYTCPRLPGSGCFPASSNGLASGNNIDEATVNGICEVIERDDKVDAFYDSIFRNLVSHMVENPSTISSAAQLLFVARNIERIGDHATNVAEMVHYSATGSYPSDIER